VERDRKKDKAGRGNGVIKYTVKKLVLSIRNSISQKGKRRPNIQSDGCVSLDACPAPTAEFF
jgi:hypothetical protein